MDKTRNYGIDFLRIVAMFFILIYHLLGNGGIREAVISSDVGQFVSVWFWEVFAYCGVNMFALISGYVGYRGSEFRIKYSNLIMLWLQVFFYGMVFLFVEILLSHKMPDMKTIAGSILPVACGEYWYFSAYFGVVLLGAFINRIVYHLTDNSKKIIVIVLTFFTLYSTIAGRFSDPFNLNNGHSFVWLLILYFTGACLKKYEVVEKVKIKYFIWTGIICFLITWMFKLFCSYGLVPILGNGFYSVGNLFIYYLSPTTLGLALCFLGIFGKMHLSSVMQRIVNVIAPLTFGIYIIHEDSYIKELFIIDKFIFVAKLQTWQVTLAVLGYTLFIFIICACIECCRNGIFKLLRVRKFAVYVDNKMKDLYKNIIIKEKRMP